MARPLPLLFATLAGFAAASACYAERPPPPTFRYACDSDADCDVAERCMAGLCQVPCTQLTFDQACTGQNHLACFNGVCSTGCDPTGDDPCAMGQQCVDLGLSVSGGGIFGGGSEQLIGVCGALCSADSCPAGEECVEGLCAVTCESSMDCPAGLSCFVGFCVPGDIATGDEGGSGITGETTTAADASSTAAGTTTATTGGAT